MNITIAKFDLLFNLFETSDGLLGYITFRSDLFTKGSVNWLLSIYDGVLGQFGQHESLDQSVQTLMATVEAQLRSKTRPEIGLSPFPSLSMRTTLR